MSDLLSFLMTHWALSSLFALTLVLLVLHEWYHQKKGALSLSPQELTNWVNHDNARLIDIRDAALFKKGHIAGSISVDASLLGQVSASWHDKAQAIVVVCQSGTRAAQIAAQLQTMGFSKVAILSGGIHSWQSDNLPLVKRG